jgi:hypothetical protein
LWKDVVRDCLAMESYLLLKLGFQLFVDSRARTNMMIIGYRFAGLRP